MATTSTLSLLTATELQLLAQAQAIDADRIRRFGSRVYNHGAANLRDRADRLRNQVRNDVYARAGAATGEPSYSEAYIRAGLSAQRAAGLSM